MSTTEGSEESLACGTSLAEEEHTDFAVKERRAEVSSSSDTIDSLREFVASGVLTDGNGDYTMFTSPFEAPMSTGKFRKVPLVYCDHTASNRPVKSIEKYMEKVCLPLYGNTHTNTSITGSQR